MSATTYAGIDIKPRAPFDDLFYAELLAHAMTALREGKPFELNADAAFSIIQQAALDRAALRKDD